MTKIRRFTKVKIGLLIMVVLMLVPQIASARSETMPRTAPPPNIVQPFASFTGYKYLQSSLINFNDNKNQKVEISITSQTKSSVQQLGISVVTQKWTGSAWTDFSSTSTINKSNTSSLSEQVTKEIESGYYFRIKVTHTAKQGTVTEQAVEYSQTFVAA